MESTFDKNDGTLALANVRISYPHLFTPKSFANDPSSKAKYSADLILHKVNDAQLISLIHSAIATMKQLKWGDPNMAIKNCAFRDGDAAGKETLAGHMVLSASSTRKPQVVDQAGAAMTFDKESVIYAGCRVNVVLRLWQQDNAYGKGVNCFLNAVQFAGDDERLGGDPAVDVAKYFGCAPAPATAAPATAAAATGMAQAAAAAMGMAPAPVAPAQGAAPGYQMPANMAQALNQPPMGQAPIIPQVPDSAYQPSADAPPF